MRSSLVKNWFGPKFDELHPLLQNLHLSGGQLAGEIEVSFGSGLAGIIGRRIAKKLGIPGGGKHQLEVCISHHSDGLHWDRTFDGNQQMKSIFKPVGTIESGYWLEKTGPMKMKITVDIIDGGWHWRCLKLSFLSIPVPLWMIPQSKAYKQIEDGQYRFYVGFFMPVLGKLFSYGGLLNT
ncbi:DUF4166 domain-containing protein [Aliikangiella coralliicola]|uniref:DUF4166 domain-containing protein n=1 Tax=Aliikangiella coralliicola TaxID=2592383 RepID=A0A545UET6_9GAMM|nr:DUF4166 domain-containing protein [Aliikangiella coralliicola]TQV87991.1 DUF4166 domain-containing protein [Aliikangiella coralliicola]